MQKHQTTCCALCIFTANNDTSVEELTATIDKLKEESKQVWTTDNRASGERACICITTPTEMPLEYKLNSLGFKPVSYFNRRNGYPKGTLTMWFLSW